MHGQAIRVGSVLREFDGRAAAGLRHSHAPVRESGTPEAGATHRNLPERGSSALLAKDNSHTTGWMCAGHLRTHEKIRGIQLYTLTDPAQVDRVTKRKSRQGNRPARTPAACQALMVVDGKPIRRKARLAYQKALRDLERAKQEIEAFHRVEKPSFLRWLSSNFGALLTQIRETSAKLAERRQLLLEIESEAFFANVSLVRAYQRVQRQRQAAEQEPDPPGPETDSSHHEPGFGSGGKERQTRNPFEDGPDDFFRGADDDFEGWGRSRGKPRPGSKLPPERARRIKELYRALARLLHPDTQRELTGQRLEWWHQTQAAYEAGDVEQLEVLVSLCEIELKGTTDQTSISLLMRITRQFQSSLRAIRRQLAECRRDPSWRFSQRTDKNDLLRQTQRMLEQELGELQYLLCTVNAQLDILEEQSKHLPQGGRSRRRGRRAHPEFLFQ